MIDLRELLLENPNRILKIDDQCFVGDEQQGVITVYGGELKIPESAREELKFIFNYPGHRGTVYVYEFLLS